ncbi:GldG family protein, partial [Myxococcota bacterium]|nr:GldG family protein [Myxococcota bacterium]MBU1536183.1 GldG family protein [Myxococcota bacterium]
LGERLDTLREPISVSLFSSGVSSNLHFSPLVQIENSLNLFSARSGHFSWRRIPIARPGLAQRNLAAKYGLNLEILQRDRTGLEEGVVVVESGNRFKVIPLSTIVTADVHNQRIRFRGIRLEAEIASALAYLADPKGLTLCITGGHGEKNVANPGPTGLSRLMNGFKASGWSIRELSPIPSPIPAKCTLLFIPSPTKEFLPDEIEAVESHLLAQGGVLITMDEEGAFPDRLGKMLARWNMNPTANRILDPKKSVGKTGGWLWASMVAGSLAEKNWRIVLEGPREILVGKGTQVLMDSSGRARRVSSSRRLSAARGKGAAVIAAINSSETPGRLGVLGFTLPLLNRSLDERGESSDSATELVRYLANWGGKKTTSVPIPEMPVIHHHLNLKSSHISALHLFAMLIWPLMAMSIGIWVTFRRRK